MNGTDPMGKAQALSRPQLPKRFYTAVDIAEAEGGWWVRLDGRPVRTPKRRPLVLPRRDLAEAVAAEWAAVSELIDPAAMPLTRLVNSAIDGVAETREAVVLDAARYAGADLICYRAEEPPGLVARQTAAWDPLVEWARVELGLKLNLAGGVMHVEQPPETVKTAAALFDGLDTFTLTGLHVMTTLTGSLVIALAVLRGRLTAEDAWTASLVDEDWQISQWGEDAEAMWRRARNQRDMAAAARLATRAAG